MAPSFVIFLVSNKIKAKIQKKASLSIKIQTIEKVDFESLKINLNQGFTEFSQMGFLAS